MCFSLTCAWQFASAAGAVAVDRCCGGVACQEEKVGDKVVELGTVVPAVGWAVPVARQVTGLAHVKERDAKIIADHFLAQVQIAGTALGHVVLDPRVSLLDVPETLRPLENDDVGVAWRGGLPKQRNIGVRACNLVSESFQEPLHPFTVVQPLFALVGKFCFKNVPCAASHDEGDAFAFAFAFSFGAVDVCDCHALLPKQRREIGLSPAQKISPGVGIQGPPHVCRGSRRSFGMKKSF